MDATLLGRGRQGIQGPLRRGLGIGRLQCAGQFVRGFARRGPLDQREDDAAFERGEPWLAPTAGFHAQAVESARVEGMQPFAYRLRMAVQLLSKVSGVLTVPAPGDHVGMPDPIGGRMATVGQFADLALFERVEGWASGEMLGHGEPPCPSLPHTLDHHYGTTH